MKEDPYAEVACRVRAWPVWTEWWKTAEDYLRAEAAWQDWVEFGA
ncbi:hypothetical protein [Billgrantia desiderata]|nr:hypothetical protein [Halomonas desiderata]